MIKLWPGYETLIREMEKDTLLCVEISHKVSSSMSYRGFSGQKYYKKINMLD